MRRSVQPNCPRAMTCCFFVSLKVLAMPAEGPRSRPPRQRLERLLPMAVFQVSMYGRFWVSTEAVKIGRLTRLRLEDIEHVAAAGFEADGTRGATHSPGHGQVTTREKG